MARPHYVTLADGQAGIWRSGIGRPIVLLPSLVRHAGDSSDEVAARLPGYCVTALEWPGVGASAGLNADTLQDVAESLRATIDALGLTSAPVAAVDIATGLVTDFGRPMIGIDAQRAAAWASQGFSPRDLAIRHDGTHLTALWAFMRDAALLQPGDRRRGERQGDPLPTPDQLDRAVVAASIDPRTYARLWDLLLDGVRRIRPGGDHKLREATWAELATNTPSGADFGSTAEVPRTAPHGQIWCDYVDTPSARIHLRRAGNAQKAVMILQSAPGSTEPLSGVIRGLANVRSVVAPDFPGNGDSTKPTGSIDITRLGAMMLATADALGLGEIDLWGTHTGALVALEMALQSPGRIGKVILEAPPILPADFSQDILQHYLPPLQPDRWGLHLQQAWNMRRDMFLFWPWYRDRRETIRPLGLPDTAMLHQWTVGLLKSGATYDLSYRAAFEYPTLDRLPLISRPTLLTAGPTDMLVDALERVAQLGNPLISAQPTPATVWYPNQGEGAIDRTLDIYRNFLIAPSINH